MRYEIAGMEATTPSKPESAHASPLGARSFDLRDQRAFASFSGDNNPVHLDALQARRTIAGQIVVHGIHAVLWALECYVAHGNPAPARIAVNFRKPIFLAEEVHCAFSAAKNALSIWAGDVRLVDINLRPGEITPALAATPVGDLAEKPKTLSENDLANREEMPLRLRGDWRAAEVLFPALCASFGLGRVCDLAATSEIVGMQAPGLNSLYLSLQADFVEGQRENPYFRIDSFDARFRMLNLVVETASLSAKISALVRPPPVEIAQLHELDAFVRTGEFRSVNALIVGGSRGLGEAAAKLIAYGGGEVTITYSVGATDAARVAEEIKARGGGAKVVQLDVTDPAQIAALDVKGINQLYFFATPKIFGKRGGAYDVALFERFKLFYVDAFAAIVDGLRSQGVRLAAFYPSSVAIEQPMPELAEYIAAKLEGEQLCARLSGDPDLGVLCHRLPRIHTDQTASVVVAAASDAVEVMAPLVRAMAATCC